ncbi:hypothetical protein GALL_457560 [mine drainage metagenome]|uniref:Uncharacterized protein n=1 Tax=mine drainage metagenome TaxID=410659 RepID=A0A1J5PYG5_9ZZZZ
MRAARALLALRHSGAGRGMFLVFAKQRQHAALRLQGIGGEALDALQLAGAAREHGHAAAADGELRREVGRLRQLPDGREQAAAGQHGGLHGCRFGSRGASDGAEQGESESVLA